MPVTHNTPNTGPMSLEAAQRALLGVLKQYQERFPKVLLALSGGADSALLLHVAADVWGPEACVAVTSRSESLPAEELRDARAQAAAAGVKHVVLAGAETQIEAFQRNDVDRCFHCKWHLYGEAKKTATAYGIELIMDGTNADDGGVGDLRPGMKAADMRNVVSPLREAGISKLWVRAISKARGLSTWDKPAEACLSSRFPYGTRVSEEGLGRVYRAERVLRDLGFRTVRVRVHDPVARIELDLRELTVALSPGIRERIVEGVKAEGFDFVALDLEGFRSGSLNPTTEPGSQSARS